MRVANALVWHSQKHGDPISNLKLQKLLYYTHGWFLALNDRLLFSEPIEAWIRGPVVRSVWQEFNGYAWKPIVRRVSEPTLSTLVLDHIDEVMFAYGDHSAYQLEELTHRETPWLKARDGLSPKASSSRVISNDDIYKYFSKLASRKN
jgi:uncharacterized phage-associated protein